MNASPPRRPSPAYRYLFVLGLGLLIGLVATVMVGRALQSRRDPFPDSLMQVMQRQSQLLLQAQQRNRCSRPTACRGCRQCACCPTTRILPSPG